MMSCRRECARAARRQTSGRIAVAAILVHEPARLHLEEVGILRAGMVSPNGHAVDVCCAHIQLVGHLARELADHLDQRGQVRDRRAESARGDHLLAAGRNVLDRQARVALQFALGALDHDAEMLPYLERGGVS